MADNFVCPGLNNGESAMIRLNPMSPNKLIQKFPGNMVSVSEIKLVTISIILSIDTIVFSMLYPVVTST